MVRNVQSLENFPTNDGFISKLLGVTALTVVVVLFALNFLRRVPAYLRLFPFLVCASACTNTQQNGRSVNALISNVIPVELELGAAYGAGHFLPDWPANYIFRPRHYLPRRWILTHLCRAFASIARIIDGVNLSETSILMNPCALLVRQK